MLAHMVHNQFQNIGNDYVIVPIVGIILMCDFYRHRLTLSKQARSLLIDEWILKGECIGLYSNLKCDCRRQQRGRDRATIWWNRLTRVLPLMHGAVHLKWPLSLLILMQLATLWFLLVDVAVAVVSLFFFLLSRNLHHCNRPVLRYCSNLWV